MTFLELFKGNDDSFGQWNPATGKMHTEKSKAKEKDFDRHLSGAYGIGRVPITTNGTCWWGAIDIDCHEKDSFINIDAIAMTIFSKGLPLIPCRSKSGGVHCYVFLSEPIESSLIKKILAKWAIDLNYANSEIFPKQTELRDNQLGNWINLPYFNKDKTNRYAVEIRDSKPVKLSFNDFVLCATNKRLSLSDIQSFIVAEHQQAPPCIQRMLTEGVPKGYRNEAIYAFITYFKKKLPAGDYKQAVLDINNSVLEKPLNLSEVNRTIQSASRKEYKYKCQEDPCRSYCNSKECIKRDFGIDKGESFETGDALPEFNRLRVINTEPPVWELTVNETSIIVETKVLRHFPYLAAEIMEKLFIVVPIIKPKDWMQILSGLMANVEHISAPDDASVAGVIREKLTEFVIRADFNSNGRDTSDRDLIERGHPVVQDFKGDGKRCVVFRGVDFVTYLKRTRSEELKGNNLWMALRKMGVGYKRLRVSGKVKNLWFLPIDGKGRTKLDYNYNPDSVFVHDNNKKVVQIINGINF